MCYENWDIPNNIAGVNRTWWSSILSDKLRESLISSSKKIAIQIAQFTKEKNEFEEKMNEISNEITMTEAKIEVHRERRDDLHRQLAAKKLEKNEFFSKRDQLIAEKRALVDELRGTPPDIDTSDLKSRIDNLSDRIGEVIESSKELSTEMQEIYEESQVEHENMIEMIEKSKQIKYESDSKLLFYRKKIAEIDGELSRLRRKMGEINEKLDE